MDASAFITKWKKVYLTERSASQQHFLDLCELLGHPKPAEADPTGESFTFEKAPQNMAGVKDGPMSGKRDSSPGNIKGNIRI